MQIEDYPKNYGKRSQKPRLETNQSSCETVAIQNNRKIHGAVSH